MKKLYVHKFRTTLGWFRLASTDKGLGIISFGPKSRQTFNLLIKKYYGSYKMVLCGNENKKAEKQISKYLSGRLRKFSLKLDIKGTPFQKKALRKIKGIPYGTTKTYGAIASSIGHPGAGRAVGSVNAANRLPIVIPCHRVVASNGPGGYAGGIGLKKHLLDIENAKY